MGQARLTSLALLSIENEIVDKINFGEVIDRFAEIKSRTVKL